MGPVLARYGFTPDKKGSTELRAVIADLANQSKEIRLMNTEIQKLVISNFPDLRGDKVPLQKSGTPGSTAASTAPPSADEEASTHLGHLCQSKRAKKTRGGGT
ncbi:unnamed protein product [Symbiodinium microadriaticum]|nr:unnamed protein product [Symbiodinium microadriaticum]CAE7949988.1 unnamed protein product [Symbiodinium sp. KB8]